MYQGEYLTIDSFAGGQVSNQHPATLAMNQFSTLNNFVVLPGGKGIRMLYPSKEIFTTINSPVNGVSALILASGTSYVVAVGDGKFWTQGGGAAMTNSTGAVTITAGGYTYLWSFTTFNDQLIAFGGSAAAPDAPFKWTGTGNASALGGTSPSAYGCFSANNRLFAFRTSANPSSIYWSIIGDPTDFAGAGSGSAVVGSASDGSNITAAAILNNNTALIFKNRATYQMVLTSSPFPVFTMFDTVGCVGKNAVVNIDGEVYWINQYGRMVSTNGDGVKTYPDSIDDKWNALAQSAYPTIAGFRVKRADHDWVVWAASTSTTNNCALIWDLNNKCWLTSIANTEFAVNCGFFVNGATYMGNYTGSILEADTVGGTTSVTSTITSGQINLGALEKIVQVNRYALLFAPNGGATIAPTYGYDFGSVNRTITLPNASTTGTSYWTEGKVTGRGNHFQYQIAYTTATAAQRLQIYKIQLGGKVRGQKTFTAG